MRPTKFFTLVLLGSLFLSLNIHSYSRGSPDINIPWNAGQLSYIKPPDLLQESELSFVPFGPEPVPVPFGPDPPPEPEPLPPVHLSSLEGPGGVGDEKDLAEAVLPASTNSVWVVLEKAYGRLDRSWFFLKALWAKLNDSLSASQPAEELTTDAEASERIVLTLETSPVGDPLAPLDVEEIYEDKQVDDDLALDSDEMEVEEQDYEEVIMGSTPFESPQIQTLLSESLKEESVTLALAISDVISLVLLISFIVILVWPDGDSIQVSTLVQARKAPPAHKLHRKYMQTVTVILSKRLRKAQREKQVLRALTARANNKATNKAAALAAMTKLECGLGTLLQHAEQRIRIVERNLLSAQQSGSDQLEAQKTKYTCLLEEQKVQYESQVEDLRNDIGILKREAIALQERIANPPPRPPPKTADRPKDIIALENEYIQRELAMEREMMQRQKHFENIIAGLDGALTMTTKSVRSNNAEHQQSVDALKRTIAERDSELADANRQISQLSSSQKAGELDYLVSEQVRAQQVLCQRRVEELVRTHASENDAARKRIAMLEEQVCSLKRTTAQQRACIPPAGVNAYLSKRAQPTNEPLLKPLAESRRVFELEQALATQQTSAAASIAKLEAESRAQKLEFEKYKAEMESQLAKKSTEPLPKRNTVEKKPLVDEPPRIRELEKILVEQQNSSQKRIFKLEEEAQAEKLSLEKRVADLETSLARHDVDSARTTDDLRRQGAQHLEYIHKLEQALTQAKNDSQNQVSSLQGALAQAQSQLRVKGDARAAKDLALKRSVQQDRIRGHQQEEKAKQRIVALEREVRELRAKEQEGIAEITRELAEATTATMNTKTSTNITTPTTATTNANSDSIPSIPLPAPTMDLQQEPVQLSDDDVKDVVQQLEDELIQVAAEEAIPSQSLSTTPQDPIATEAQIDSTLEEMLSYFDTDVAPATLLPSDPLQESAAELLPDSASIEFWNDMKDFFENEVGPVPLGDEEDKGHEGDEEDKGDEEDRRGEEGEEEEQAEYFELPEQQADEIAEALASLAGPSDQRGNEKASDEDDTAEFLAALSKEEETMQEEKPEEKKRLRIVLPDKRKGKQVAKEKEKEKDKAYSREPTAVPPQKSKDPKDKNEKPTTNGRRILHARGRKAPQAP